MDSKRQKILRRIQEIIQGITVDGNTVFVSESVKLDKQPPLNLATTTFPQCFIYSDKEDRVINQDSSAIGSETWEWTVVLEVWGSDNIMESLLNYIHSAMFADYSFDGLAEYSQRMGADFQTVDPTQQIESMVIPYNILYRHSLGNMEE